MSNAEGDLQADGFISPGYPQAPPLDLAPKTYDSHPLFPRDDGMLEDADIQFVTFIRRTAEGLKHSPADFPALLMQGWEQVVEMWGGGDYQAIAKDVRHRVIRHCPSGNQWKSFDGDPKPMVMPPRPGPSAVQAPRPATAPSSDPAAASAAAAPAAVAASGITELVATVAALVKEVRDLKAAPAPHTGTEAMVAMMNNQVTLQAAQIKADGEVRAAQVKAEADARMAQAKADADARVAQAQATTENNKFLLGLMTRGGGSEEKLVSLLSLLKPYMQPPQAAPERDVLGILKEAKELFPQAAPPAGSEIKPIADMFGGIMTQSLAADAKKAEAAAELRKAELQAGRAPEATAPQRRDREPPPLVHVAGLGMVHVVAPDATPAYYPPPMAPALPAPAAPVAQAPTPMAHAAAPPHILGAAPATPAVSGVPSAPAVAAVPVAASPAAELAAPSPIPAAPPTVVAHFATPPAVDLAVPSALPSPGAAVAAPLAPSGAVETSVAPDAASSSPAVESAAPVVLAPPEHALEMPAAVRAIAQEAARDITEDDCAAVAGALGRMSSMTVADRVSVVQRIFPLISVADAKQAAEMILQLPMLDIYRMIPQLPSDEVVRAKDALGIQPAATPGRAGGQ